jgi:hypothetical protein
VSICDLSKLWQFYFLPFVEITRHKDEVECVHSRHVCPDLSARVRVPMAVSRRDFQMMCVCDTYEIRPFLDSAIIQ